MVKPVLPLLTLGVLLAACGQQTSSGLRVPTSHQMILQDGTVDPGSLSRDDYGLKIILRPQPAIAQRVASGSLTLQGKTFQGVVNDGTEKGTQPGDVGPLRL